MLIRDYENFLHGLNNKYEDKTIPKSGASGENNWLTSADRIELRRGSLLLGAEITGAGKITGLFTAKKNDGTDVTFRTRGQKVEYYNSSTELWVEVTDASLATNILGSDADGEDVEFASYDSPAGNQVWLSSPNSGLWKIMVANPGIAKNNYDSTLNYKGYITIRYNRMTLWNKSDVNKRKDKNGVYDSWIDQRNYTTVTAESLGTGDGATKTFGITLAALTGKRTVFGLVVKQAGTAVAWDDYNGIITGTNISGTINYSTGVISVTWVTAPTGGQALTVDYQWEDATNNGIADFGFSGTRLAGEGNVYRQDDSKVGPAQVILPIENTDYCIHEFGTYALTRTNDDTNADNNVFNESFGIPNHRAACSIDKGIVGVTDAHTADPKIKILRFNPDTTMVEPTSISDFLDLSDYRFDTAVVFEFGDFVCVECRHKDFTYNQTMFIYNKRLSVPGERDVWDKLDYFAYSLAINNGTLWGGDSLANNVYVLFSGLDDDESEIPNEWEGHLDNDDMPGHLKKTKILEIDGYIGPNQTIDVYLSTDRGDYGNAVGSINGQGDYVDSGQSVAVGALTLGKSEVGGGGEDGDIPAYHYTREIKLRKGKYEYKKIKFVATGLGYASISNVRYRDVRDKGQKLSTQYRS